MVDEGRPLLFAAADVFDTCCELFIAPVVDDDDGVELFVSDDVLLPLDA
jgi:hypothetical protein